MRSSKRYMAGLALVLFLSLLGGCASLKRGVSNLASFARGEANKKLITQAELQDDLLRFESQFNARIQNASQALETSADPKLRYRAALNRLIYGSNSLNIALGPAPESNLLDMVAFIELSHDVLKKYWIPNVFGAKGQALDSAFADSKQQIWAIAGKVLNEDQKAVLQNVISAWSAKHPGQVNVETVRLSAFSTEAGAKAEGIDQNVSGLFASVQQSTEAMDDARLFAERALYFAERLPFLLRDQARLGAQEIIHDTSLSMTDSSLREKEETIASLLKEFQQTVVLTHSMLNEAHAVTRNFESLSSRFAQGSGNGASLNLAQLTSLLRELNQLLRTASSGEGMLKPGALSAQIDHQSGVILKRFAWLGAGLICFFWAMYVVAKLTYQLILRRHFPLAAEPGGRKAA